MVTALLLSGYSGRVSAAPDPASKNTQPKEVTFNAHIRPIFSNTCFACHGSDAKNRAADLRLDTAEGAYAKLKDFEDRAIVLGKPEESAIIKRLWSTDTKQTTFDSVQTGPKRDLVREFVDACRSEGLGVGLYYPWEDFHHPDCLTMAYDTAARERFVRFNLESMRELMSNYGKIDILWYGSADM